MPQTVSKLGLMIELYTTADIPNIGKFGLGITDRNNEFVSYGNRHSFSPSTVVAKHTYFYFVSHGRKVDGNAELARFLGRDDKYAYQTSKGHFECHGIEAIELFYNGIERIDLFGVIGEDGTNHPWNYANKWVYRKSGKKNSTSFNVLDWTIQGDSTHTDWNENGLNPEPFPVMTYQSIASGCK